MAPEGFRYCGGANVNEQIAAEFAPPPPMNTIVGDGSWNSILRGEIGHTNCAVWEKGQDGHNVFVGTRLCIDNEKIPCSEFGVN